MEPAKCSGLKICNFPQRLAAFQENWYIAMSLSRPFAFFLSLKGRGYARLVVSFSLRGGAQQKAQYVCMFHAIFKSQTTYVFENISFTVSTCLGGGVQPTGGSLILI